MFFKKKVYTTRDQVSKHLQEFYDAEKERLDDLLELYIEKNKVKAEFEYANLLCKGNKEINQYECEWHSKMEAKKVELAKLDALIVDRSAILNNEEKQIVYLKDLVKDLCKALENK